MRPGVAKGIAILALALIFVGVMMSVHWPQVGQDQQPPTTEEVAKMLFGEDNNSGYGLVMFLIGLLLLVALLGGVFLAKEEKE
jgi:NADH:ubiquinone oxidoreductase subunit 6 (subunit J)